MRHGQFRRLSRGALVVFSSPMFVFQAVEVPWRVYMPAFLTQGIGLSLAAVAALLFWVRVVDTLADPVIGFLSDRTATPIGRRRPWMIASVPFILLGAGQLFFALPGTGLWEVALWSLVLHLGCTMLVIPHGGWSLEVARTAGERTRVMGCKMWVYAAGMPLTLLLPSIGTRFLEASLTAQIAAMGWLILLVTPVTVAAATLLIGEPAPLSHNHRGALACWQDLKAAVARPVVLRVLLLYALLGAADAAEAATFLFFIEEALALPGWTGMLLLVPALVGLAVIPLWTAFGVRVGKRTALAWALGVRTLTAPLALVLPADNAVLLLVFLLVRSLAWGADYLLLRAMVADQVGEQSRLTGEGYAATHYALFNIASKLAGAVGVALALGLLDAGGFLPGQQATATIETKLRMVYGLPSCIAGLIGLLLLRQAGGSAGRLRAQAG